MRLWLGSGAASALRISGLLVLPLALATACTATSPGDNGQPADAASTASDLADGGEPAPATSETEPGSGASSTAGVPVTVDRVIDGDSLELLVDGEQVEVRLLGINAPELYTPDDAESCNGQAARSHLEELLGSASSLRFVAGDEDRFGRRLGELLADGASVNQAMTSDGWALALWSSENAALIDAMMSAADAGLGLWGSQCGDPESDDLAIADWQVDPAGNDRENIGDEWVVVANRGTSPVDLTSWTIRDETTSNRFPITGYTLGPGDEVRFRSGPGTTQGGDYFLGSDFPVWSNRGETVLLLDPAGRVAAYAFVAG